MIRRWLYTGPDSLLHCRPSFAPPVRDPPRAKKIKETDLLPDTYQHEAQIPCAHKQHYHDNDHINAIVHIKKQPSSERSYPFARGSVRFHIVTTSPLLLFSLLPTRLCFSFRFMFIQARTILLSSYLFSPTHLTDIREPELTTLCFHITHLWLGLSLRLSHFLFLIHYVHLGLPSRFRRILSFRR